MMNNKSKNFHDVNINNSNGNKKVNNNDITNVTDVDDSNNNIDNMGDIDVIIPDDSADVEKINNSNNISHKSDEKRNSEIFNDIKRILTSTLRTKLLISLFSSKKDLKSLRAELDKPSTSILHGVKQLRKLKLIKKEDGIYELSSNGKILAANILKLVENTSSINNNVEFWNQHTIEDIPQTFLKKIYNIHNARHISSINSSIGGIFSENLNEYLEFVSKSRKIKILTPIFFDIQLDIIINNLISNVDLELITTDEILDYMRVNGYGYKLISLKKHVNIKIWKYPKDFKIFLTSCDNFISLGLFSGEYYDDSSLLLDEEKEGINWGLGLFEYYKKDSVLINLEEYFDIFEGH
ncbi:DUF1724 domain-containing protein [Methanobrevibacter sp. TMH8]|uniref:helix-turn-helix transcriptional regulator n=1 Tax=Methanobrevibacter sp. TMH8 TaxID=2848611 RepID=UPI001CCF7B0C|nr:transcriptional regulator FilR1 domain-containing protein [Methanobrevibacter sp. TMH8]MBZ9571682.1 DUF1724 domain-containing protein [Methanobrevibacter sp. TMH8]